MAVRNGVPLLGISIHAPRGGSDKAVSVSLAIPPYFNPRSPWGERQLTGVKRSLDIIFQSTLPVGGATVSIRRLLTK